MAAFDASSVTLIFVANRRLDGTRILCCFQRKQRKSSLLFDKADTIAKVENKRETFNPWPRAIKLSFFLRNIQYLPLYLVARKSRSLLLCYRLGYLRFKWKSHEKRTEPDTPCEKDA